MQVACRSIDDLAEQQEGTTPLRHASRTAAVGASVLLTLLLWCGSSNSTADESAANPFDIPIAALRLQSDPAFDSARDDVSVDAEELIWWEAEVGSRMLADAPALPLAFAEALVVALSNAPELKALHDDNAARRAEVIRQDAAFDWLAFVDTIWNRDSNPVASQLDGAANRLRSRSWSYSGGVRRRNRVGGEFSISQDFGFLNTNSTFVLPNNQGTARMALQYEQPLLRGKGLAYNEARMEVAAIDEEISYDNLQIGIQDYLLEVAHAYWTLTLARGRFAIRARAHESATSVKTELEHRTQVDAGPTQLNRTVTEVANRQAAAVEAYHDVKRAQERLLRFLFADDYPSHASSEVITTSLPPRDCLFIPFGELAGSALYARAEMHRAIRRIRAACVEQRIAKNEVLPALNFLLTGYVAGLQGDVDLGGAFQDQFREGEPGVGTGLTFEYPLGNRAAESALRQRRFTASRFRNELNAVAASITLEVRDQVTENNKYVDLLRLRHDALRSASKDLRNVAIRKQFLVDGTQVAKLYLEDMLQSQNRLVAAEVFYLESQVACQLAKVRLDRASGALGMSEGDTTELLFGH